MLFISCDIELDLSWLKESIMSKVSLTPRIPANPDANASFQDVGAIQPTRTSFQINNVKLYVPVVTLSINDNIKFLENLKQRFKWTISWNKYRSESTTQPKNNNLDYLIDTTVRNMNRLFALPFKNGNNVPKKDFFDEYYMPLVEIEDFNALIDNKPFFDQPVKNKQETYEKLVETSRNNNYTTRNLLDHWIHENIINLLI